MSLTAFSSTTWGPIEKAVLSALCHDWADKGRILDDLKASDFFLPETQKLYTYIASEIEAGRPTDPATLSATMTDGVTRSLIIDISGTLPSTPTQVERHIEKLKELSRLRTITRALEDAKIKLEQGEPSLEIATGLENAMKEVETDSPSACITIAECADKALEGVKAAIERGCLYAGIPSGIHKLDQICGGWQAGQLIGIAARTGEGKTALALQLAIHAARFRWNKDTKDWDGHGHPVVLVELEMSAREIGHRAMSHLGGPPMWKMRDGLSMTDFDKANLHEARGRLEGIPFFVDDPPRLRLSELRARARRWRKKIGMELLIVDLLGKVSSDTKEKDRWREVALVSHGLKALAKELGIPVMAVCQLNRDSVGDGEAGLHHLRESGDIEQDLDVAILLTKREDESRKLKIAKNRNGFLGSLDLAFDGDHQSFKEIIMEAK